MSPLAYELDFREHALDDIAEQYQYLREQAGSEVANRFLDRLASSAEKFKAHPFAGAPRPHPNPLLSGVRTWPVKGFAKIRLYYQIGEFAVDVLRVLHGARNVDPLLEARPK